MQAARYLPPFVLFMLYLLQFAHVVEVRQKEID
jgi:hypothetical protein